jgi:Fic family protein
LPANENGVIITRLDKIASLLEKLLNVLAEISERLENKNGIEKVSRSAEDKDITKYLPKGANLSTLLELPDHLRNPLMALFKLGGKGTAKQVSQKLGISRPQASATLNSLVHLHLLVKKRESKEGRRGADAIFSVPDGKLQK